jgi:hypothetical protein
MSFMNTRGAGESRHHVYLGCEQIACRKREENLAVLEIM